MNYKATDETTNSYHSDFFVSATQIILQSTATPITFDSSTSKPTTTQETETTNIISTTETPVTADEIGQQTTDSDLLTTQNPTEEITTLQTDLALTPVTAAMTITNQKNLFSTSDALTTSIDDLISQQTLETSTLFELSSSMNFSFSPIRLQILDQSSSPTIMSRITASLTTGETTSQASSNKADTSSVTNLKSTTGNAAMTHALAETLSIPIQFPVTISINQSTITTHESGSA